MGAQEAWERRDARGGLHHPRCSHGGRGHLGVHPAVPGRLAALAADRRPRPRPGQCPPAAGHHPARSPLGPRGGGRRARRGPGRARGIQRGDRLHRPHRLHRHGGTRHRRWRPGRYAGWSPARDARRRGRPGGAGAGRAGSGRAGSGWGHGRSSRRLDTEHRGRLGTERERVRLPLGGGGDRVAERGGPAAGHRPARDGHRGVQRQRPLHRRSPSSSSTSRRDRSTTSRPAVGAAAAPAVRPAAAPSPPGCSRTSRPWTSAARPSTT